MDDRQPAADPPPARCFVAMPFGRKSPVGRSAPSIDFDAVYAVMKEAVEAAGVECTRADFNVESGFIHKEMYEGLLLARYVIADLSLANANVAYEIGIRHGANAGPTLLLAAEVPGVTLPFDFRPLRVAFYGLDEAGDLSGEGATALRAHIGRFFDHVRGGDWSGDNPLVQLSLGPRSERLQHEKADRFIARIREASSCGAEIAGLLEDPGPDAAERLAAVEMRLLGAPDKTFDALSALLSVFLAYREVKAYERMKDLAARLPEPLAGMTVVREQLALALSRLAEAAEDAGAAEALRKAALRHLAEVPASERTSETWGIEGRVHKASYTAAERAGGGLAAAGHLDRAIDAYDRGLRADPRDYYPGVNAVTLHALRLSRGGADDEAWLARAVPVVRFAVDRLAEPANDIERYWRAATRLELAVADRDWKTARADAGALLAIPCRAWMRETTSRNLEILLAAFGGDPGADAAIREILDALSAPIA